MSYWSIDRSRLIAALAGIIASIQISGAQALQYQLVPIEKSVVMVLARGPIIAGDFRHLYSFFQTMPQTDRIVALALDSPGGNVFEAERIAGVIRKMDLSVFVSSNSQCSSACFLLFAAATRRFTGPDALIGVHSVSENGKETFGSMALTTAMARDAAAYGVPPEIIGKLVETPPGRATWLTPYDIAKMGVTVLEPVDSERLPAPQSTPDLPTQQYSGSSGPANAPPAYEQPKSTIFDEGLADRRAWETWFDGLTGDFQKGAAYWAAHRSLPNPGSCYGPRGERLGDWTAGCIEARNRLRPSDIRRESEPDYRLGWNSF